MSNIIIKFIFSKKAINFELMFHLDLTSQKTLSFEKRYLERQGKAFKNIKISTYKPKKYILSFEKTTPHSLTLATWCLKTSLLFLKIKDDCPLIEKREKHGPSTNGQNAAASSGIFHLKE